MKLLCLLTVLRTPAFGLGFFMLRQMLLRRTAVWRCLLNKPIWFFRKRINEKSPVLSDRAMIRTISPAGIDLAERTHQQAAPHEQPQQIGLSAHHGRGNDGQGGVQGVAHSLGPTGRQQIDYHQRHSTA